MIRVGRTSQRPSSSLLAHGCWTGTALSLLKAPCLVAGRVAPCAHTAIRLVHTTPRWGCGRRWGRTRRPGRGWGRTRGWSRRADVTVDPTALCVGASVDGNPIAIFTPRSGTIQHPATHQRATAVAVACRSGLAVHVSEDTYVAIIDWIKAPASHLLPARGFVHYPSLRFHQG